MNIPDIIIYTDGACFPNPGLGGWACIWREPKTGRMKEASGVVEGTTNNRMELFAAVKALEGVKLQHASIRLISDSKYLICGFTQGWSRAKNADLWEILAEYNLRHVIEWVWARSGEHAENVRCDELANAACGLNDETRPKYWKGKR